jgi:hypothetical protein
MCSAPTFAQVSSDPFAAASSAFSDGDYLRALALFEDARNAGSQGPSVQYNIGVCQYRLGLFDEAALTFRALADDYPAMRELALYNLGLVRTQQDRTAEARTLFSQVREDSNDGKLVALAEAMLRRTAPARSAVARPAWNRLVDINIGYDDNVALIDEASVPATQSVGSAFTDLLGVISGPRRSQPGFRFDGSAYLVAYGDASQFDQTAIRAAGSYEWALANWRLEVGPQFNFSTLDGDGFEQRLGIGALARRRLTASAWLTLRATHDEIDNASSRFAYIEGSRDQLGVSVDLIGGTGRLTLGYDIESNDRADPGVSPSRNRLWVRYRYSSSPDWSTDARLALRNSSYDDLAIPRDEDLIDLTLGYTRRFAGGWEASGGLRWSDNDSNISLLTYSRSRFNLGLTKNF